MARRTCLIGMVSAVASACGSQTRVVGEISAVPKVRANTDCQWWLTDLNNWL